jgi:hypothetical protein
MCQLWSDKSKVQVPWPHSPTPPKIQRGTPEEGKSCRGATTRNDVPEGDVACYHTVALTDRRAYRNLTHLVHHHCTQPHTSPPLHVTTHRPRCASHSMHAYILPSGGVAHQLPKHGARGGGLSALPLHESIHPSIHHADGCSYANMRFIKQQLATC